LETKDKSSGPASSSGATRRISCSGSPSKLISSHAASSLTRTPKGTLFQGSKQSVICICASAPPTGLCERPHARPRHHWRGSAAEHLQSETSDSSASDGGVRSRIFTQILTVAASGCLAKHAQTIMTLCLIK
jgi:hypothetical protein